MRIFRFIAALLLTLLAVGFGLCGLCVTVLGNSEDKVVGAVLMLVALGAGIGGLALWRHRSRQAPDEGTPRR
jgi:hypothetical protein